MLRLLLDALVVVAVPGGIVYGSYRVYQAIRRRQREKRVKDLTYAAIMDRAATHITDAEWSNLYRKIMAEPEIMFDDTDAAEKGWKQRVMLEMNRRWPRA